MLAERHSIGHNYDAIFVAFCISWIVDRVTPDKYDLLGGWIALLGVLVIMYAHRR